MTQRVLSSFYKLQLIVSQYLSQMNRISERDREQVDQLKDKYRNMTQESASLTKKSGWIGLGSPVMSSAVLFAGMATGHPESGKFIAEQWCPRVGDAFVTGPRATQQRIDALAQLIFNEFQTKTGQGQSNAGAKQDATGMLDRAQQVTAAAARG